MPKARVLPEPVGARPQTSRPARASAMVAAWIANGSVIPWAARERLIGSGTPNWAKVGGIGSPGPRVGRAVSGFASPRRMRQGRCSGGPRGRKNQYPVANPSTRTRRSNPKGTDQMTRLSGS